MRKIAARFPSRCRDCGARISVGETIYWQKGQRPLCESCGSGNGKTDKANKAKQTPTGEMQKIKTENVNLPAGFERGNEQFFTIDWADFKELMKDAAFNNRVDALKNPRNVNYVTGHFDRASFSGATRGQVQRWLTEGFKTDAISGLAEFIPPIREKRRLQFLEEGDELLIDVAWSGADNYFATWTKRETIPGVAIEASIMFSAGVSASTVAAYNVWICKTAYSLETAGVDCEITLDFPSWNLMNHGRGKLAHNIVRVKKENEATDFLSWSAMLSPASLRVFGFSLGAIHADAIGDTVTSSFGNGIQEQKTWDVVYDEERRVIQVKNAYSGYGEFPEAAMTEKLRTILKKLNSSGG